MASESPETSTRTEFRVESYHAETDDYEYCYRFTSDDDRKKTAAMFIRQLADGEMFRVTEVVTSEKVVSIEEMLATMGGGANG